MKITHSRLLLHDRVLGVQTKQLVRKKDEKGGFCCLEEELKCVQLTFLNSEEYSSGTCFPKNQEDISLHLMFMWNTVTLMLWSVVSVQNSRLVQLCYFQVIPVIKSSFSQIYCQQGYKHEPLLMLKYIMFCCLCIAVVQAHDCSEDCSTDCIGQSCNLYSYNKQCLQKYWWQGWTS